MSLYQHQKDGLKFLLDKYKREQGAILAFDMGTGKTLTSLAWHKLLLKNKKIQRTLVVCEASHLDNWITQCKQWLKIDPYVYHGANRKKGTGEIVITTYGLLSKDKTFEDILYDLGDYLVIADEAHENLQSYHSKRSKDFRVLSPQHTVLLTGTPIYNKPEDLYHLIYLCDRNLAGGLDAFDKRFLRYATRTIKKFGKEIEDPYIVGYKNIPALHKMFCEVATVCYKEAVVDLPPKNHHFKPYALEKLRMVYEQQIESSDATNRNKYLKEISLLSGIIDDETISNKTDKFYHLLGLIGETKGKRIIWCYRKASVYGLEKLLSPAFKTVTITGDDTKTARTKKLNFFREEADLCIATIQSIGTGTNMQYATTAILWELPMTGSELDQAIDRSHRIGTKDPVDIYYLFGQKTVEELQIKMIKRKNKLCKAVIDGNIDCLDELYTIRYGLYNR